MSKTIRVPSYRLHSPTGQAVVTLNGKDHYLGKWNTKPGKAEYNRLIGEWLAGDTDLPSGNDLTVAEVCTAYWRYAKGYVGVASCPSRRFSQNIPSTPCPSIQRRRFLLQIGL